MGEEPRRRGKGCKEEGRGRWREFIITAWRVPRRWESWGEGNPFSPPAGERVRQPGWGVLGFCRLSVSGGLLGGIQVVGWWGGQRRVPSAGWAKVESCG
jgi:hypothetical protein